MSPGGNAVLCAVGDGTDQATVIASGSLPLPQGAQPWTPYGMLTPPRQATGNGDGLSATCDPVDKRGWERRYHHVILVMDREGNKVQWWQDKDALFHAIEKVDKACENCHLHYWYPNDKRAVQQAKEDGGVID